MTPLIEPSSYMQTLTRYLSNIMNSTLLGLPREIKELIYFDALNHTAEKILVGLPIHYMPKLIMLINCLSFLARLSLCPLKLRTSTRTE